MAGPGKPKKKAESTWKGKKLPKPRAGELSAERQLLFDLPKLQGDYHVAMANLDKAKGKEARIEAIKNVQQAITKLRPAVKVAIRSLAGKTLKGEGLKYEGVRAEEGYERFLKQLQEDYRKVGEEKRRLQESK